MLRMFQRALIAPRERPKCGNCEYFARWDRAEEFVCKRFPPVPVAIGQTAPAVSSDPAKDGRTYAMLQGVFPGVQEVDVCGEHQYAE